jgi:hypothetical protein
LNNQTRKKIFARHYDLILYFSMYLQNCFLIKSVNIVGTKVFLGYEKSSVNQKGFLVKKVQYENLHSVFDNLGSFVAVHVLISNGI